jgi:hypothetical protein
MVDKFIEIFTGLQIAYGQYIPTNEYDQRGKQKGKPFTARKPVVKELWEKHLAGAEPALGIIPINEKNLCRWGCIDIDKYNFNHKEFVDKIRKHKLPLVVCRSKSGGAHVFLFTTEWIDAALMRNKLKKMSALLGVAGSEIFPKQDYILIERGDLGSFLNLPYHGGNKSLRYAFKDDGEAASLEEFYKLYDEYKIKKELLEKLDFIEPAVETKETKVVKEDFHEGPPCLQILSKSKIAEGGRNNGLYNIGVYLKKSVEKWETKLMEFNIKYISPPLDHQEVNGVIKSISGKDYQYKCKDTPICDFCDPVTCATRKYGIGNGVLMPELSNLRIYTSEPPIWFVSVDGKTVCVNSKILRNYDLFDEACMEQIRIKLPSVPKPVWNQTISELFNSNIEIMKAPEVLQLDNQLKDHLENFTTDRAAGKTKNDLLRNTSWTDEGKTYFRYKDFWNYLSKTKSWNIERNATLHKLQQVFKAKEEVIKISGKSLKVIVIKELSVIRPDPTLLEIEKPPYV